MTHRILHLRAVRQVITGSHDKMIKMWDLRKGKTMGTLTYHKKSVRAMAAHPTQFAFAAASADNIKKYQLPQARRRQHRRHRLCCSSQRRNCIHDPSTSMAVCGAVFAS